MGKGKPTDPKTTEIEESTETEDSEAEDNSNNSVNLQKLFKRSPFTPNYNRIFHLILLIIQALLYLLLINWSVLYQIEIFFPSSGFVFTLILFSFWCLRSFERTLRAKAWFLANSITVEVIFNTVAIIICLILIIIEFIFSKPLVVLALIVLVFLNSFVIFKIAKVLWVQHGTAEEREAIYKKLVGPAAAEYVEFSGVDQSYYLCIVPHNETKK